MLRDADDLPTTHGATVKFSFGDLSSVNVQQGCVEGRAQRKGRAPSKERQITGAMEREAAWQAAWHAAAWQAAWHAAQLQLYARQPAVGS